GRLLIQAIYSRDYPLVQGCILIFACLYALVNLLVDLLYGVLDPRIQMK
ncbi:ABC transporter permease subunit, partial [bacterium]|nr:ABC transporter permease subunit [bacterium]